MQHVPVMKEETRQHLALQPGFRVCDATLGMAGHTRMIAEEVGPGGHVYACDTDAESMELAKRNCAGLEDRISFHHTPFSRLRAELTAVGAGSMDALLADFGTSLHHFTDGERGFSLNNDGPLNMKLDRTAPGPTAADLVNFTSERELADLLYKTTGERRSRVIARALVRARPVTTTRQFAEAIASSVSRIGKLHPATVSALALRILTNNEYEEITALIQALPTLVRPGGRVVLITFHSGEDLIAKTETRRLAKEGRAILINKHVLVPTPEEVHYNPPSRSAKMRVLEIR